MLGFLILLAVAFLVWAVMLFNGLHGASELVREAHSNIIVSMKKRIDLANKLIDIASSYGDHEKLTHISVARSDGSTDTAVIAASAEAAGAVQTVLKMATRFPELRASETYNLLMTQLEAVEANLQERRETYNAIVRAYNLRLGRIPTNLVAPALGFRKAPYFNVDDADSLEGLKEFSTADGEVLRTMLAGAGRKVLTTTKDVSLRVAETTADVSHRALEKGREAADRYQAQQIAARANSAPVAAQPPVEPAPPAQEVVGDLLAAEGTDGQIGPEDAGSGEVRPV
jgi:LemA protein